MNIASWDEQLARDLRLRLWAEHLERDRGELEEEPAAIIDRYWRPLAKEQLRRREQGAPLTHRLLRLPHASRRSSCLRGPLSGFLVDG